MGFSRAKVRDAFFDRITDGALVIIWTRRTEGEQEWIGKFRGILQLEKVKGQSSLFSSAVGVSEAAKSSSDFMYAVRAVRAWEAHPLEKVHFSSIAPSIWPGKTQSIGHRSGQMEKAELHNLDRLKVREVTVYEQPSVSAGIFNHVGLIFK